MRNAAFVVAGVTLVVLLTSFTPVSWTRAPVSEPTLSSVSPSELMAAIKNLSTADQHHTH